MRPLRLIPDVTRIDFMRWRYLAFAFTLLLTVASVATLASQGLSLGIDFRGGILVEARSSGPPDLATLRSDLDRLGLGEVTLQEFGDANDLLIRVEEQAGGVPAQAQAIERIKQALGPGMEIRRTEFIGPQVSNELLVNGVTAALLAVVFIAIYVWFRFEWQFGLAALVTTLHDVIATFGLFSALQLEFNLTVVAALLTIAGYSINDTVVVFDRIREDLRRYKTMPLDALINHAVNSTLSRTVMTGGTTMLAVLALLLFGGPVLFNFALAMAWGILIGTYSSVFVAAGMLLHLRPLRAARAPREEAEQPAAE